MSSNVDDRAVTVSVRIYERLLATYPAEFRREYGPAMKQLFRDQCRDAWSESRGRGLAVLWLRVLPDLAKTSFVEHLSNLNQKESMFMRTLRALRADPRLRGAFIRVFAWVFIGAIVCGVLVAQWLPRIYSSTVRIEVQKDTPEVSMLHPQAADKFGQTDPYFLTTQFKIIESYSILTNVIVELNLRKKLPAQLGEPPWTIDKTFAYLSKMINVRQTRMTSLIEVSVKNPDPQMAATIANGIAMSYRRVRLEQWKQTHLAEIEAYRNKLDADEQFLRKRQVELDELRKVLGVSEDPLALDSPELERRMLQIWGERDAETKVDYLEYSNVLFNLEQIPHDKLGVELATAYTKLSDVELTEKLVRLSYAKDEMTAVKAGYGVDNPKYKTAIEQLQHAQEEYDNKVDGIVGGIRVRVDEDRRLLEIIEENEKKIVANENKHAEALRPYYRLKDEVDNLRNNGRESERYLNQEIAEAGQPPNGIVIVRDPARPALNPANPHSRTFLLWMFGGTVLALVAGGVSAWVAAFMRRLSPRHSAP